MTCYFCLEPIAPGDVNLHHPVYRSQGGTHVEPSHERCHKAFHREQGDYAVFGRIGGQISALDKHWAFYLNGVKADPLYDQAREFYRSQYAH